MELAVAALRVVLVAVFSVSGVAKLGDRAGTRQAMEEFGVPARFTKVGSVLLPVAELAIAAALLFVPLTGAIAGLVLLLAFEVAIANAMVHDRAPDCHCFGQLHSAPAGGQTFARNVVLLVAAAGIAYFGPGPGVHTWVADRSAIELVAFVAASVVAVSGGWLIARRQTEPREPVLAGAPDGRPVGSPAPEFTLRDIGGRLQTLDQLISRNRPVVLVFVHPGCKACENLLPGLVAWRRTLAGTLTIAILSEGPVAANEHLRDRHGIDDLLLQEDREVYDAYEIRRGTPAAVVVDPDGTIASPTVSSTPQVEELIRQTLHRPRSSASTEPSS